MIEIRPVFESEAPEFLRVLCDVFNLDQGRAGTIFYSEPFFDLSRKWALFQDRQMVAILTTTPLQFGFGSAIGIAGVGTLPDHRDKGYGQKLLEHVLEHSDRHGESRALLFAHRQTLYARVGFELVDHVIKGPIKGATKMPYSTPLPQAQVQEMYAEWANVHPMRIIRDSRRWDYWHFVYRESFAATGGYIASETNLIREAVISELPDSWPVIEGGEWYGLRSMTAQLGIPLQSEKEELLVMARNFPDIPQMFMSDQF
jgi:GNAT superfamily N-acetyltransferase